MNKTFSVILFFSLISEGYMPVTILNFIFRIKKIIFSDYRQMSYL